MRHPRLGRPQDLHLGSIVERAGLDRIQPRLMRQHRRHRDINAVPAILRPLAQDVELVVASAPATISRIAFIMCRVKGARRLAL